MRLFYSFISYLFHPILIPIAGTLAYFLITPRFSTPAFESGNILPIFILTVIIPIISFLILKNIGLVNSISMPEIKERKYPYFIGIALLLIIIFKVIPNNYTSELYYYFIGLVAASFTSLLLLFMNFKSSMHLMGMGSLFMFLVSLSIHFEINIIIALSVFILATGIVATSRLYLRAHQKSEVIVGFLIGVLTQLFTIKFWL